MSVKLYVGNLPYGTTDQELRELFVASGDVASASIVTDRESGRSRGFGFVEMASQDGAENAIASLNGRQLQGRAIVVNEARPREDAPRSGSGRGDGSRRGGGWGSAPGFRAQGRGGRW